MRGWARGTESCDRYVLDAVFHIPRLVPSVFRITQSFDAFEGCRFYGAFCLTEQCDKDSVRIIARFYFDLERRKEIFALVVPEIYLPCGTHRDLNRSQLN